MALEKYKQKRNFRATPEPEGTVKKSATKLIFVIQRHKASRLHYDLRLEMNGTLKSWAVPKGPSMNPADKRLAMMVEDHPYSYRTFEGVIPEGNYGAGIVEIWDSGTLYDVNQSDPATAEKKLMAGLKAGNLKFVLEGKKVRGEFALVRLHGKEDNTWLLIKHRDEFAVDEPYNSEQYTLKNSPINQWLKKNGKTVPLIKPTSRNKPGTKRSLATPTGKTGALKKGDEVKKKPSRFLPGHSRKLVDFIRPMLAKEAVAPFTDEGWIYEIKWDGYRAIAEVSNKQVSLYSRNGNTFNASYPAVVDALNALEINAVLDGEIVALNESGEPSFQLLQHYDRSAPGPLIYYVFDVLEINGTNTTDLSLLERKKLLKNLLPLSDTVIYSDHVEHHGEAFFEVAKARGLEGIIAKKADSLYYPGQRTGDWLKIKNHQTQDAIIAGFTAPGGSRKLFGALVLAVREGNQLKYVGHTGTGFNEQSLRELYDLMMPLVQPESPFKEKIKTNMPVTWVKPVLVAEIKYTEMTRDGSMRHPVFLHLRDDKKASEVTRVKKIQKASEKSQRLKAKTEKSNGNAVKTGTSKAVTKETPFAGHKSHGTATSGELKIGKITIPVTNTTKLFWPAEGYTKGDVINYYQQISDYILPYLTGRPQSLMRTPNGINQPGFYHKDAGDQAPEWVERVKIFSESTNKDIDYILCNNKPTLAYLANLGCIELNPWHSTVKALDKPDYLVIDLDPSDNNTFEQVIETAQVVKTVLDKAGASCFCKTSGATGLHVYIPTGKKYTYEQVKDFAHLICVLTNEQLPAFTSLERNLKKRGRDHIYLDHLQNRRGQTIASAYSLRPKKGATVSTPLEWKEVKKGLSPLDFTIETIFKRLQKKGDLFKGILGKGIDLQKCLKNLGG
jgi:bifunctional non-homologous end joining protein LigD